LGDSQFYLTYSIFAISLLPRNQSTSVLPNSLHELSQADFQLYHQVNAPLETSFCVFLSGCPLCHTTLSKKQTSRSKQRECSNSGQHVARGCPGVALHSYSSAPQPCGSVAGSHTTADECHIWQQVRDLP